MSGLFEDGVTENNYTFRADIMVSGYITIKAATEKEANIKLKEKSKSLLDFCKNMEDIHYTTDTALYHFCKGSE